MSQDTLVWSSQLLVSSPDRAPRLTGDKITLPQSALEQLLAAAPLQAVPSGNSRVLTSSFDPFNHYTFAAELRARQEVEQRQQQLPHPLIFRIVNPRNGRFIYAGIREFSAEENEVALSALLRESLDIKDEEFLSENDEPQHPAVPQIEREHSPRIGPAVTVHAKQLPKGTYVRLRPLEAGYDPEDWKALLEKYLRDNFTTLTTGELLTVPGTRSESFRFLVDKVFPEGEGICVVDTDLEVDIVALSEDQARETLQKRLEKASRAPGTVSGSSIGGILSVGENVNAQVLPGEYVDYELRDWSRQDTIQIELTTDNPEVSLFASPFSTRQRGRPRSDMHALGDFSSQSPKKFILRPTNVVLEDAEALYIAVHADAASSGSSGLPKQSPSQYHLRITLNPLDSPVSHAETEKSNEPGDVQCKNCQQWVPERTLVLHENFCLRNNILCPQCQNVFQKRSTEWQNHWHCPHDSGHGNDAPSKEKHATIFHQTYQCTDCAEDFEGLPSLAQHRTTDCPGKLILCQFCHLLVPQKGDSNPDFRDPEVMLSGLTPHELVDGGRTTECHLCSKIIRLRDMNTHLRHHDLERLSRPAPRICMNKNCGRTLSKAGNEAVGLCSFCFGPLYVDTYDPEGKALRRRIERRYLSQMMTGCGKPWCQNEYCKTAKQKMTSNSGPPPAMGVVEIMKLTRPLVEALNTQPDVPNKAPLYLCADETSQQRRDLAELIAAENTEGNDKVYDLPWCIAGAEAAGGDLEKAREWLSKWAPTRGATST
ncbi:Ubiquitin fusion degradation protein UFD1 [Penicillium griseofulvum]|uniref:Ubiquitin fusion degradation protein UFD1 n=1 Tax=Penicillium patulum TaxID=5078 RepID=A0A135LYB1_PENPA|nr:Ubiquitin fusion degradation protein UFD1 [Penicillium griseofulvum]KXG53901.1 Ubiquitin fusion degradation protein UFD1 [Penicillium griseofulvum]